MTAEAALPKLGGERHQGNRPLSIYEVHLDSWRRKVEEQNRPLTCAELGPKLAHYAGRLNFTHIGILATQSPFPSDLNTLVRWLSERDLGVVLIAPWSDNSAENWDRTWAELTLDFMSKDPDFRPGYHHRLTSLDAVAMAGSILPLSHELVLPGQGSLLTRMPGDEWRRFANLRLLYALMYALPGGKLLFMGGEFGQWNAWNSQSSLDWHLVQPGNFHARLQNWVAELNRVYRGEPSLHQTEGMTENFEWVDSSDASESTLSFLRHGGGEVVLAVFNFSPEPRYNYRVGVPGAGAWRELLNSDAVEHGGSGQGNLGGVEAAPLGWHSKSHSLMVTLPPLGAVFFKHSN